MGVKSCFRKDCENIMCDTYIQSVGYVCTECQSEFKEYLRKNDSNPNTEAKINEELVTFMRTSKDRYVEGEKMNVDQFFNKFTE